jgi:hypothetical protein
MSDQTITSPANWYHETRHDVWNGPFASRDVAIEMGRDAYDDGAPFKIARGYPRGAWDEIFNDWQDLADHIDGRHEDQSNEDGFTAEANLGKTELQPLCDQINALWKALVDKEKPTGNILDLSNYEDIPGTDEWIAAQSSEATHA